MLTFTENMKRIEHLTKLIALDIQAENYDGAREHLFEIHIYTKAAQMLFDKRKFAKSQDKRLTDRDTS